MIETSRLKSQFLLMKLALTLTLWIGLSISANAQISERPAYDAMLQSLLDHNVPELQVQQVLGKDEFIFLDARAKEEYDVSHIPGAIWVGYDEFEISKVENLNKLKILIVYCSVGYRSEKVARQIYESGNENVANLYGGIFQWVDEGGTVVNDDGVTQKVHAFDHTWGVWLRTGEKVY